MGRLASIAILTGFFAALALPGAAGGTEAVTASLPAAPAWNLEVGVSYAATTNFGGGGIALRGGWLANRYLVIGLGIETTRLHAEGMTTGGKGQPPQPYSQTFLSTFPAAFLRAQLPFRFLTPYAELASGFVVVHSRQGQNTECAFGSGPGAGFAVGVDARIVPSIAAGVRAGVRNPGWGVACVLEAGPWTYQDDFRMTSLALTTRFLW